MPSPLQQRGPVGVRREPGAGEGSQERGGRQNDDGGRGERRPRLRGQITAPAKSRTDPDPASQEKGGDGGRRKAERQEGEPRRRRAREPHDKAGEGGVGAEQATGTCRQPGSLSNGRDGLADHNTASRDATAQRGVSTPQTGRDGPANNTTDRDDRPRRVPAKLADMILRARQPPRMT